LVLTSWLFVQHSPQCVGIRREGVQLTHGESAWPEQLTFGHFEQHGD
jgi:hypothetical protein